LASRIAFQNEAGAGRRAPGTGITNDVNVPDASAARADDFLPMIP